MLAWSEIDNGRQKPEIMAMTSLRRRAIYWLPGSPSQTCHAKPKTQINRRRTLPASFPLAGCLPQQFGLKDFSPKSQDAVALLIKERGALPMIDRGDIRQAIGPLQQYLSHYCRAGYYGQFEHKADSLIAIQRSGRNGQRDDVRAESPRLSPLWLSASSSACHGLLIITVITLLPTKPPWQKCQRTEVGERGNYWHADVRQRDVAALDAKYTKELADAKAENDARVMMSLVVVGCTSAVCQSRSHHRLRRG